MRRICRKLNCNLVGQEQDISNFSFRNKKKNIYKTECKDCQNKASKNKLKNNKLNANRLMIPISIQFCSNKNCQIISPQIIHSDNKISDFNWKNSTNKYDTQCKSCIKNKIELKLQINKQNSIKKRIQLGIIIKKCNDINCLIEHNQYINPDDNLSDFYWNNDDYKNYCKSCISIINKNFYKKNRRHILKNKIKYNKLLENKNRRNKRNKRNKDRRKNDITFKLRELISNAIGQALKFNKNKSCLEYLPYTIKELKKHLENNFEYWMSWSNHGTYNSNIWNDNDPATWTWQIDHIIPQSKFIYISMEDNNFRDCWSLSNLRPYSAKNNIIDGNRR